MSPGAVWGWGAVVLKHGQHPIFAPSILWSLEIQVQGGDAIRVDNGTLKR